MFNEHIQKVVSKTNSVLFCQKNQSKFENEKAQGASLYKSSQTVSSSDIFFDGSLLPTTEGVPFGLPTVNEAVLDGQQGLPKDASEGVPNVHSLCSDNAGILYKVGLPSSKEGVPSLRNSASEKTEGITVELDGQGLPTDASEGVPNVNSPCSDSEMLCEQGLPSSTEGVPSLKDQTSERTKGIAKSQNIFFASERLPDLPDFQQELASSLYHSIFYQDECL